MNTLVSTVICSTKVFSESISSRATWSRRVVRERGVRGKDVDTPTRFEGEDGGGVKLGAGPQLPSFSVLLGMDIMLLLVLGWAIRVCAVCDRRMACLTRRHSKTLWGFLRVPSQQMVPVKGARCATHTCGMNLQLDGSVPQEIPHVLRSPVPGSTRDEQGVHVRQSRGAVLA